MEVDVEGGREDKEDVVFCAYSFTFGGLGRKQCFTLPFPPFSRLLTFNYLHTRYSRCMGHHQMVAGRSILFDCDSTRAPSLVYSDYSVF